MKRLLPIATALLLAGCGGSAVLTPAPISNLAAPDVAPWLTVKGAPDTVTVRGLDRKVMLQPAPSVARAVQSGLGVALSPDYFANLVVSCPATTVELRVDQENAPGTVTMNLALHCSIWARGAQSEHDYKAQSSAAVAAGSDDNAYAHALPELLAAGANGVASQLRSDIQRAGGR